MDNEPSDVGEELERVGISSIVRLEHNRPATSLLPANADALPDKVDLSEHLHFIRKQGGLGCWGYSFLAIWDIMNEIVCPYSPNLSFRMWKTIFYKHLHWHERDAVMSPDGRYHDVECHDQNRGMRCGALNKGNPPFFTSFGCTTEGTDPSLHNFPGRYEDLGWSTEAVNEAENYRIESDREPIGISSDEFMRWLADSHPIQISGGRHVVAVVGYDKTTQTFKVLDSAGDKAGDGGFHSMTFQHVDNSLNLRFLWNAPVSEAYILPKWKTVAPPRPVPAARIHINHDDERGNVDLWIGVEDSPLKRNKIWSHGWKDNCRTLNYTVRLPSEFIWPPSETNRIVLEIHDIARYSSHSGGEIVDFTVAFGGHTMKCSELTRQRKRFSSRDHLILTIP